MVNGQLHATTDLPPRNSTRSGTPWTGYVDTTCPNGMQQISTHRREYNDDSLEALPTAKSLYGLSYAGVGNSVHST
jgi:hypothetical protein